MIPRYKTLSERPYRRYTKENSGIKQPASEEELPHVHGSYGSLLFDQRWKERRLVILERDGNRCIICSSHTDLQVHHRQYHFIKVTKEFKPPWDYTDDLLITLCETCHKRGHNQYKVPIIKL